ncbi:MAG: hypothetical protein ACT4PV_01970 [Planctomycetaceae bacterium]
MRSFALWGCAATLTLAAFHTVHLRRQVYAIARDMGGMNERLEEARRRNGNLLLRLEAARSPRRLLGNARERGVWEEPVGAPERAGR